MEFQHGPWIVRWSGWRQPVNQHLSVGYWYARRPGSPLMIAATTTGTVRVYQPMHVLDFTLADGWPVVDPDTSRAERDAVQERACLLLTAALDDDRLPGVGKSIHRSSAD